ncbi:vacuolar protein sorting-associated protein 33a-like [Plasmopara halstedii]|uniref:Vacuolar protein sorting-associated protein 33a-like n=1 Tax=Plasmopara halstedii TaxID=4781 RepID=A0A0P1AI90_PLAHL|nr:vacuolar protein sorting-associated protein 33a-like [Plasmopara halstedii]CEG40718.1 vacuolar protein sorting-associated protein 33a-like [Plasmopara halstedii]|eukprot:XP_024577087.1 vacuolar protein sorting-associated protein 33a-like [Plasmopara halstedii]
MELENALKTDALIAFTQSIKNIMDPSPSSHRKVLLAVDSSQLVIFELLAYGSGGNEFYDKLGISRLLSVQLQTGDPVQLQRQLGIFDQLQLNRGDDNKTQDIVVIAPPLPTVAKRVADALRPLELVVTRRCAVLWLPAATSDVTLEMERQGVAGYIRQANLDLGLIPVDRGVAALCHDSIFGELYVKGDSRSLSTVVKSILATEKHTGRRIADITCHGFFAERAKKMLELAHGEQQKIRLSQITAESEEAADINTVVNKLVIIDRMEDPLSMLLTPMTYEGLLDALVGVNHGVVTYEKEVEEMSNEEGHDSVGSMKIESTSTTKTQKVVLNHLDALFDEIRDVNFNLVSNQLVDVAKDLATEVRGGSSASNAGFPKDSQAEFQKVKALLAKAPHLVKKKRSLAHHLQLVQRVRDLSTQLALRGCVETEMTMMSAGPRVSSAGAKSVDNFLEEAILREPPLNLYDVVKLLCLCSLVRGKFKPETLAWYRQQLCHTYGHQVLPLLVQLEKMDLLSVENRFDFPKKRKQFSLMRGVLDDEGTRYPTDIHFMFPYTGYAPLSIRLLQESLGMKYKTLAKDSTSSLLNPGIGSENEFSSHNSISSEASTNFNVNSGGNRTNVLVYYVGGVTVAELTAFRFLNQKQSEFSFFIAATSICNGSRLLRAIY